jgi:hypothetical protein
MKYFSFILVLTSLIVVTACNDSNPVVQPKQIEPSSVHRGNSSLSKLSTADNIVSRVVWNWYVDNYDYMLTVTPDEYPPSGSTFLGQLAYIKHDTNDAKLYRLYSNTRFCDHMVSPLPNEASPTYQYEGTLGSLWSGQQPGLLPFYRYYNSVSHDHDAGFNPASSSYTQEGLLGYAIKRYGNNNEQLIPITYGPTTIKINQVAGGSVWELWWNNKQFINHYDYGREMQIAVVLGSNSNNNPTEGGDYYSDPNIQTARRHGSPLISYSTFGNQLVTQTSPLQWVPEHFFNGNQEYSKIYDVVIWNGTFSKTVTFNTYSGQPRIIKWTTTVTFPSTPVGDFDLEVVTPYLNNEFNKFCVYDAQSQITTDIAVPVGPDLLDPTSSSTLRPSSGGGIISTSDGSYALGIYQKNGLRYYDGFGFLNNTDGTNTQLGANSINCSKIDFIRRSRLDYYNLVPTANTYTETVYIVIGTKGDCISMMAYLNAQLPNP